MSNRTRNVYTWKTRTEDGEKRQVRAHLFGGKWTFQSLRASDDDWVVHERPALEDLEELERILFSKYQRKHVAWEHILSVRKLLARAAPPETS